MPQHYADEDLYGGAPAMEGQPEEPKKDDIEGTVPVATLPREFFMGQEIEPGDEFYVRVQAVHGQEVVVEYPQDARGPEEEEIPPGTGMGEMGGMDELMM